MILFFFLDDWNSLKGAKDDLRWLSLGPAVFTETNQPDSLVDLGHRWGFSWPFQFTYSFEYLECIPSSARADHMTVSIFSWRTSRLISIGLELTFLPIDSEYSPLFSPSSSAFVDFVFLVTILTGKKWNLTVVFAFPWWLNLLNISRWNYWPFLRLLESVVQLMCHWLVELLVLCILHFGILQLSWILVFCWMYSWQRHLLFCRLSLHAIISFYCCVF